MIFWFLTSWLSAIALASTEANSLRSRRTSNNFDCTVDVNTDLPAALNDNNCNSIFIPDGTYPISSTIKITRPVTIVGESRNGTILQYTGSGSFVLVVSTSEVIMERLTLDAKTYDSNSNQIWEAYGVFNSNDTVLSDTKVLGSDHMFAIFLAGPYVDAGQATLDAFHEGHLDSNNIVENNHIIQYREADVLSFSLQKYGSVSNNVVEGGVISFFMNKNSECSGNSVLNSMTNGIFVSVPAEDNLISNNYISGSKSAGIKVDRQIDHRSPSGEVLTPREYRAPGIIIKDNTVLDADYFGMEIVQTQHALLKSNTVQNTAFSAIYSLFNDRMRVMDNRLENYGVNTGSSTWSRFNSGFFGDYKTEHSRLFQNRIIGPASCAPYGIRINSGEDQSGNVVKSNIVTGCFEGSYISVSETNNRVTNNNLNAL